MTTGQKRVLPAHLGELPEIAEKAGMTMKQAYRHTNEAGFPAPVAVIGKTKIFPIGPAVKYLKARGDRRRTVNA